MLYLTILKDAIILFLLIYAIMDLCHHVTQWLLSLLHKEWAPVGYYVLDLSSEPVNRLEYTVRYTARHQEKVLIVTDTSEQETIAILQALCREFDHLTLMSRQEFSQCFERQTDVKSLPFINEEAIFLQDK